VLLDDLFEVLSMAPFFEKISKYFIPSDRFSSKFKHIEERCSKMKYFEIFSKDGVVHWTTNKSPENTIVAIKNWH
jgi:hypothetical protein